MHTWGETDCSDSEPEIGPNTVCAPRPTFRDVIKTGSLDTIKHAINRNGTESYYFNELRHACILGRLDVAQYIYDLAGADYIRDCCRNLDVFGDGNSVAVARWLDGLGLLHRGTVFLRACARNDTVMTEFLYDERWRERGFRAAATGGAMDVVRALGPGTVTPHELITICAEGHVDVLKYLHSQGDSAHWDTLAALETACVCNQVKVATWLLANFDIDAPDLDDVFGHDDEDGDCGNFAVVLLLASALLLPGPLPLAAVRYAERHRWAVRGALFR